MEHTPKTTEEARAAVAAIMAAAGVTCDAILLGERKHGDWTHDAWNVAFKRGSVLVGFDYKTGTGHRETVRGAKAMRLRDARMVRGNWQATRAVAPHAADVLHSILLDSSAASQSFYSWCSDYGYDSDSRKALATYEACQENADKLARIFNATERAALADALRDY